jgi:hypothetical protein
MPELQPGRETPYTANPISIKNSRGISSLLTASIPCLTPKSTTLPQMAKKSRKKSMELKPDVKVAKAVRLPVALETQ